MPPPQQTRERDRQYRLAHLEQIRAYDRARGPSRDEARRPPRTRRRRRPSVCWVESCPAPRKVSRTGGTTYIYCSEHQKAAQNAKSRDWDHAHRGAVAAMQARYAASHPEVTALAYHRHRVRKNGLRDYSPVDPWPPGWCMIHAGPIVGVMHRDHDPSLAWLAAHPEYDGPCFLGPTCAACNFSAHAHGPTWSLSVQQAKDAA